MNDLSIIKTDAFDTLLMQIEAGEVSPDRVLEVLDAVDFAARTFTDFKRRVEKVAIAFINLRGDLVQGSVRRFVGHPKEVKLRDGKASEVMVLLFDACGGDFGQVCEYLASGPFKQGAIKKLIGDEKHEELFETIVKEKLEEGKPVKQLIKIDSTFIK